MNAEIYAQGIYISAFVKDQKMIFVSSKERCGAFQKFKWLVITFGN